MGKNKSFSPLDIQNAEKLFLICAGDLSIILMKPAKCISILRGRKALIFDKGRDKKLFVGITAEIADLLDAVHGTDQALLGLFQTQGMQIMFKGHAGIFLKQSGQIISAVVKLFRKFFKSHLPAIVHAQVFLQAQIEHIPVPGLLTGIRRMQQHNRHQIIAHHCNRRIAPAFADELVEKNRHLVIVIQANMLGNQKGITPPAEVKCAQ